MNDEYVKLTQMIANKQGFLAKKQQALHDTKKTNALLSEVLEDYKEFNNTIQQQKADQLKAFNVLSDYLNTLQSNEQQAQLQMTDAIDDQSKILREIQNIKQSIDTIQK